MRASRAGQALLFAFLLLALAGSIGAALTSLWQADIKIRALGGNGLIAFYLAQAAVERAKVEILEGYWTAGTHVIVDQADLDIGGDNFQFLYTVTIVNAGGLERTLRGTGRVLDGSGAEVARREVEVRVAGIEDSVLPAGIDDDLAGAVMPYSWREI